MLKAVWWAWIALAVSVPAHSEAPMELALICEGAMKGNWKVGSDGTLVLGPNGKWVSGSRSQMRYAEVPTVAEFRIKKGRATLYLPQPPSCGSCTGETGWRDIKKFEATNEKFSGKNSYGFLSGSEFEIDRRTGRMTSKNGFDGICRVIDLDERKF